MAFLFKPKQTPQSQQQPSYTALPTQTSSYGKAIPIVFGRARIAPNLGWYDGFQAIPHVTTTTNQGGKGGSATTSSTTYTYQVNLIFLLCEGFVTDVTKVWQAQNLTSISAKGLDLFEGVIGQAPWSFLVSNYPAVADPYSGIAYLGAAPLDLGDSANLDNYNFEVVSNGAGTAPNDIDATPSLVLHALLESDRYGVSFPPTYIGSYVTVTEDHVIGGSPYRVSVTHSFGAAPSQGGVRPLSVTIDGVPIPAVAGAPSSFQYSVTNGTYTFNSVNSGQTATITYAYLRGWVDYDNYTVALGLGISPVYDSAIAANTIIGDIATFTNSEFVWSQGVLNLVPRGTLDVTGNAVTYTAPVAPLFDLDDRDFTPTAAGAADGTSKDPAVMSRPRAIDQENSIKIEYLDRNKDYAAAIAVADDEALQVSMRVKRFTGTKTAHFFCDAAAANTSAQLLLQNQYVRNIFYFSLGPQWIILDPMDIVTISYGDLDRQWVRITELTENDDGTIDVIAEEYLAGTGAAALYDLNRGIGHVQDFNVDPGDINPPAIFEAPVEIAATQLEIWCAISAANANWGGADIWISSDGQNYSFLGTQIGPSRMGTLTASFPAHEDPDEDSVLAVDLSQSFGQLNSATLHEAEQGLSLCWVDGELISYEIAQFTAQYHYNLETYLRRGLGGTTIATHPAGSQFVRLDDSTIAKVPYAANQIGQTIFLKFTSFNIYMGGEQNLADVPVYQHKILGPPPPGLVQNFQVAQSPGNSSVVFTWTDLDDFALKGYDILFGPVTGTVDTASELTIASRTTEMTNASVPAGTWKFYIRGHDIVDQLGSPSVVQFSVVDVNGSVLQIQAAPDWIGVSQSSGPSTFTSALLTAASPNPWLVPTGVTAVNADIIAPGGVGSVGINGPMGHGGGGGAFARKLAIAVVTSVPFNLATSTAAWFGSNTTVLADSGKDATQSAPGTGGQAGASIGALAFSGGSGAAATANQGGGGGGAAGKNGAGSNASGGSGGNANLSAVAGGAAINPNLLAVGNQFDNPASWKAVGASVAISTGIGPSTLTFGAGTNYFLSSPQFTPASNTTYTVTVEISGSAPFRFGGDDGSGSHFAPSADIIPTGRREKWSITTGTIGVTTQAGFGITSNAAASAGTYVISYFKVEVGSVATWSANDGQPGIEYGAAGAGSGSGAGGDSAFGGIYGGGAGGVAQAFSQFNPALYGGNLLAASNDLTDPAWVPFSLTSVSPTSTGSSVMFTSPTSASFTVGCSFGEFNAGSTYPMQFVGSTSHADVYYDPISWAGLTATATTNAQALVANIEAVFTTLSSWFGKAPVTANTPTATYQDPTGTKFNFLSFKTVQGTNTAHHCFANFGDIYYGDDASITSGGAFIGAIAEFVECFAYQYNTTFATNPWNPSNSIGEALSRVGAEENMFLGGGIWSYGDPQNWLNNPDTNQGGSPTRFDYASTVFADGTDFTPSWTWSIGYGMLLIYWLRYKKNKTYPQIVQAGGTTYAALCTNLGLSTATFLTDVQAAWPAGTPVNFNTLFPNHPDNPWVP